MYECYEHIVFPIWFSDLFGIPMAAEIFHSNSLWQPKLLLIRWKLMQMSNVDKFVIHKCNAWCWSETALTRVQQETPRIRAASYWEQKTGRKGMPPPKPRRSQALFLPRTPDSPCMFSELLSFAKGGIYGLHLAEQVWWWYRFCPLFCFWLIVWGWDLTSLFLKELFTVQRFRRLQSLILETISYARYSSKLTRPLI